MAKADISEVIATNPDLIISDNVKSFLGAIKANEKTKHIPFVLLSNNMTEEAIAEADKFGVKHFVKAEVIPSGFMEEVRKI